MPIAIRNKGKKASLEIFFAPGELESRLSIHITFNMQLTPQHLRPTEEHTRLSGAVDLPNRLKDIIPIGSPKIRRCSQPRNGVPIRVGVINHDIRRVVRLDFRRQVRVDLNMVVHVLGFDGEEERTEPFEGTKVTTDPEEVDFAETSLLLRIVHAVPDGFEDGCKGRDSNTGTAKHGNLVFEDIF